MKALVLGGSRFIGLHLVRLLVEKGHEVSALNRGQTSVDLPSEVHRLYADRYDGDQVAEALGDASFDVVFDISGYDPDSLKPVLDSLEGNVGRFVFCSTTTEPIERSAFSTRPIEMSASPFVSASLDVPSPLSSAFVTSTRSFVRIVVDLVPSAMNAARRRPSSESFFAGSRGTTRASRPRSRKSDPRRCSRCSGTRHRAGRSDSCASAHGEP